MESKNLQQKATLFVSEMKYFVRSPAHDGHVVRMDMDHYLQKRSNPNIT